MGSVLHASVPIGMRAHHHVCADFSQLLEELGWVSVHTCSCRYFSERLAGMGISEDTIDFTMGLLTVNPRTRLTAEAAMAHSHVE
jgi:hypothetical protein